MSSSGNNVTFNQDMTRMSVGTDSGFQIFDLPPATNYRRIRSEQSLGGVSQVAMLEKTPLIAVVGGAANNSSNNRHLQLYDLNKSEVLTEMHFDTAILNVRINIKRLAVILDRHIHLFDLNTMQPLPQVRTTSPLNKAGIGALSCLLNTGACYFAFPQSSDKDNPSRGDVFVLDAISLQHISVIPAHNTTVVALEFCGSGTRLATCSVKGTVIRVFSNPNPTLLYTFRRGQQEAIIYSLAFNYAGDLLAVASNSGTLHLFRCDEQNQGASSLAGTRSFSKISIKEKQRTNCGISADGSVLSIVQVADQGLLTQYEIRGEKTKLVGEYPF